MEPLMGWRGSSQTISAASHGGGLGGGGRLGGPTMMQNWLDGRELFLSESSPQSVPMCVPWSYRTLSHSGSALHFLRASGRLPFTFARGFLQTCLVVSSHR